VVECRRFEDVATVVRADLLEQVIGG